MPVRLLPSRPLLVMLHARTTARAVAQQAATSFQRGMWSCTIPCSGCGRRSMSQRSDGGAKHQTPQGQKKSTGKGKPKGGGRGGGASEYSDTLCLPQTGFPMRANAAKREPHIQAHCFQGVYEKLAARDGEPFILHDGPPFANGSLHMGHVLNKVLKDMIVRYKALRGHRISFVPGWDCHGLPIEAKAVSSTTSGSNSDKGAVTIKSDPRRIRKAARRFAERAIKEQKADFVRLGVLADWEHPYLTLHPEYEAQQVAVFLRMMQAGLVQRRYRPVYWSPSSQTALAEAEIEYDEHTSTSVFVKLQLSAGDALRSALQRAGIDPSRSSPPAAVIWTTTPWTLPANQALGVHQDLDYLLVEPRQRAAADPASSSSSTSDDMTGREASVVVVAASCLDRCKAFLPEAEWRVVASLKGRELLDSTYHHPFEQSRACPIFHSDHVTSDAGTGVVHMAPAHGLEDYHACGTHGMAIELNLVDAAGRYNSDAPKALQGLEAMTEGGSKVLELLQSRGQLLSKSAFSHRYPFDWRTRKPIMLRATQQWFAQLQDIKHLALTALEDVELVPEQGRTRLSSMLGLRDEWCVSRQRVWGVPIAVFCRSDTGEPHLSQEYIDHIVATVARHGSDAWWMLPDEELFPPHLREPGVTYTKGSDTMDVWFDSGTSWNAVTAQRHGQDAVADIYLEGSDQHRGWFQSSLLTKIADDYARGRKARAPFKTIITHGFVLDEESRKMSKSLGNGVDPHTVINGGPNLKKEPAYGADVLRLWAASTAYHHDVSIGPSTLAITAENLRKIRNSCRFMLGNMSDFDPHKHLVDADALSELDKYILHRVSQLDEAVRESYDAYNFLRATQHLLTFINVDLSSFYFEITKDRLYLSSSESVSRRAAQTALHHILDFMVHAVSPIACHLAEEVHHFRSGVDASVTDNCGSLLASSVWSDQFSRWRLGSEQSARWDMVRRVRDRVFHDIQAARDERKVTGSQDSVVRIRADGTTAQVLSAMNAAPLFDDDTLLNAILMTSSVHVERDDALDAVVQPSEASDAHVEVEVHKAEKNKCPRCWRYMAVDEQTPCCRCQRVLNHRHVAHQGS